MRIVRHNVEPLLELSLQTFQVVDDFDHSDTFQQSSHIHHSPANVGATNTLELHRGHQVIGINNSPRISIRHNTSSHQQNVLLIEGRSNSLNTIHTEALDELVHLQEHSTPGNCMSWAFVRGHVHTRTRKYSDQPSFITPADLTLTVAMLWVALVAHVSMDPTAFRRRMFCFCTERR